MATIKSSAYVVGLSLSDKAKQALLHAVEVGKDTDISCYTHSVEKVTSRLCDEFLETATAVDSVFVEKDVVACVPYVDAGLALLLIMNGVFNQGLQLPGVVNNWFLHYDAFVVIRGRKTAEDMLKHSDEAKRYLYGCLFRKAVCPFRSCDVLLNI